MNQALVATRVAELRDRILRAGGVGVGIVAVTKTFGIDAWNDAKFAGCEAVGENYAQELIAKSHQVARLDRLPVHFIGQLQTNKIKSLFDIVDVWQSVDRASVVTELVKRQLARSSAGRCEILVQVNTTSEIDKGGCDPTEVEALVHQARQGGLDVTGLMTVGPTDMDPMKTRAAFALLKRMATDLGVDKLSMGMTADVEIAVEEGSTLVRVGTALFGQRPHSV
ncbi:MAG: YggS family pyridoxal phosphate-dependent enzyme [Actinomycetota bacterium]